MILERLIGLLTPYDCLVCGDEGSLLCEACRSAELVPSGSSCYSCRTTTRYFETCKSCRRRTPLAAVWCAAVFDGWSKELAHKYKYGSARGAAEVLASSMLEVLPYFDTVITFLPTEPRHVRQRGFDHARLLGKRVAASRSLKFQPLLARHRGSSQVGSSKSARISQVKDAFYRIGSAKGKTVVIVDDIMTTGASMESAAKALKKAGAKKVYGLVFARPA